MKKIITYALFFFMVTSCFSQQTNLSQSLNRQEYLKKSKTQKTAAWILLASGTTLIGIGLSNALGEQSSFDHAITGIGTAGVGVLSIIGSIPLFIASGRNRKKAMNVSVFLEMQHNPFQTGTILRFPSYPAFSIKLNF
ncbi:MAG TPA: hypothetical protein VGP43_11585 [Chitinophagaceae bacterium]|nr:hypothetical protein [Chitinophagaceae bacterium]